LDIRRLRLIDFLFSFFSSLFLRFGTGFGRGKTPKDVQFIMEAYAMSPEILAKCLEGLFALCHTPGTGCCIVDSAETRKVHINSAP